MTNQQHPITPPPELISQWLKQFYGSETMPGMAPGEAVLHVAAVAARWGSDQELEACCEWLDVQKLARHERMVPYLRAIRRPKPPSLKEQALAALDDERADMSLVNYKTIRTVLEQLDD